MKLTYEKNKIAQGHSYVIGCDEVGRGSLAGPVVAAAVIKGRNRREGFQTTPAPNIEFRGYTFTGVLNDIDVPSLGSDFILISSPDGAVVWKSSMGAATVPKSATKAAYAYLTCTGPSLTRAQLDAKTKLIESTPIAGIASYDRWIIFDGTKITYANGDTLPFTFSECPPTPAATDPPTDPPADPPADNTTESGMSNLEIGMYIAGGVIVIGGLAYFLLGRSKSANAPASANISPNNK